ncbi:MAG TPA: hypothetical protein VMM36_03980, partial [Opitutaceae bacterium]|nr:hypothetical protein [Opitutaceae bacterium]
MTPIETKTRFALMAAMALAMAGCTSGRAPTIAPAPAVALASTPQSAEPVVLVPVPVVLDSQTFVQPEEKSPELKPIAESVPEPQPTTSDAPLPSPRPPLPESQLPEELEVVHAPMAEVSPVDAQEEEPAPHANVDSASVAFLRPGELLVFRMNWGILSNIGETRIETVEEEVDGSRRFRIKISTKSRGLLNTIYPVVNDSESVIERSTGR